MSAPMAHWACMLDSGVISKLRPSMWDLNLTPSSVTLTFGREKI